MPTLLICPGERPGVGFLSQSVPLVLVPMLGKNLITYWLESLANGREKDVWVVATDRPEMVRAAVGDGSRWGLRVQIEPALQELTAGQALEKLGSTLSLEDGVPPAVHVLDRFPGDRAGTIFRNYSEWFGAVLDWMGRGANAHRIGLRELEPGIWCGLRTRIATSANVQPPTWLGDNVQIGPHTVIGPHAILENRVIVDSAAEVRSSLVGPETFVGSLTKLEESIAWGNTLIDWRSGSCTQVPDPFLLCAFGRHATGTHRPHGRRLWHRLTDVVARRWQLLGDIGGSVRHH
jgi:NDP-sugar pyrophosphorylase family protein